MNINKYSVLSSEQQLAGTFVKLNQNLIRGFGNILEILTT